MRQKCWILLSVSARVDSTSKLELHLHNEQLRNGLEFSKSAR